MVLTTEREVESFLEEYKRSRVILEATVRSSLNRALDFEKKFQKPLMKYMLTNIRTQTEHRIFFFVCFQTAIIFLWLEMQSKAYMASEIQAQTCF